MTVDMSEFESGMGGATAPQAAGGPPPKGWAAGLTLDGDEGQLTSRPGKAEEPAPGWEDELRSRGGDPSRWRPSGPVRFSSWDAQVRGGGIAQMHAYRWNLVPHGGGDDAVDLVGLTDRIYRRRVRKAPFVGGERTLVPLLTDTQIGKANRYGVGTAQTVELWVDAIGKVEDRLRDLRKLGRPASRIFLAGGGDSTEGCLDNYASQPFTVDLNESEQVEVVTSLLDRTIDAWAAKVDVLETTTVSSNHDAKRRGKDYPTGRSDCRAFTVWRSLARAYAKNEERYGHVKFWLPDDPDVAVHELHGHGVALIHGDLPSGSGEPSAKMWRWWSGQAMGELPAGDCDVLLTAHYHHAWSKLQCDKWMFGGPALESVGSQWLTSGSGVWSSPGLLTLVVDEDGVSDVAIL